MPRWGHSDQLIINEHLAHHSNFSPTGSQTGHTEQKQKVQAALPCNSLSWVTIFSTLRPSPNRRRVWRVWLRNKNWAGTTFSQLLITTYGAGKHYVLQSLCLFRLFWGSSSTRFPVHCRPATMDSMHPTIPLYSCHIHFLTRLLHLYKSFFISFLHHGIVE